MDVPHVNIHIENKVRDLLNHTGDGKISAEPLRVLHVAAAAGLPVAAVRRSIDRRNVEEDELAGFRQRLAHLIARAHQPALLIRPRSLHFTLKTGIHQFEIKHRDFGRVGTCRRWDHQRQRHEDEDRFHDRTGEIHDGGGKMSVAR